MLRTIFVVKTGPTWRYFFNHHNQCGFIISFADHEDFQSLFCGKIFATPSSDTVFKMQTHETLPKEYANIDHYKVPLCEDTWISSIK